MTGFLPKRLVVAFCLCGLLFAADASGVWLDVPFVKQEKNGCGAASIAMVMQYWLREGARVPAEAANAARIQRALYSTRAHGIFASDLEQYMQGNGFQTYAFQGGWNDLTQHLEKGRPLIVALKPSPGSLPLHYVVVTGVDWQQQLVMLNDSTERKLVRQERTRFEKHWKAAGNWTLLALPRQVEH